MTIHGLCQGQHVKVLAPQCLHEILKQDRTGNSVSDQMAERNKKGGVPGSVAYPNGAQHRPLSAVESQMQLMFDFGEDHRHWTIQGAHGYGAGSLSKPPMTVNSLKVHAQKGMAGLNRIEPSMKGFHAKLAEDFAMHHEVHGTKTISNADGLLHGAQCTFCGVPVVRHA